MATKKISRKKQRLQNLLERLEGGEDVAVRDLKNALTEDEFGDYENNWEMEKEVRSFGGYGSDTYDEYLKKGLFHHNKAQSGRFNPEVKKRCYEKAQDCFEKGLEALRAEVGQDASVAMAYDRQLDFSETGNLNLSPSAMPRRIDSKSWENLSHPGHNAGGKVTKRALKIRIVKQSLADFEKREVGIEDMTTPEADTGASNFKGMDAQGGKLAEMLRKLKG